jgi:hypothetical protein
MNVNQLVDRVKAILLTPKTAWETIKADSTSMGGIYQEYLVPLVAIPTVAAFIGQSIVGMRLPFVGTYRQPIISGLVTAVLSYVLTLVAIFLAAKVIDALAPTFGATKNSLNAFKVAAYAWTPALVAGILSILPSLSILGLLAGLYGIYLLYLGLQSLMACPKEKAVGYTAATVVSVIVISLVVGALVGALTMRSRANFGGASFSGGGDTHKAIAERIVEAGLAKQGVSAKLDTADGKLTIKTKEGTATYAGGQGTKIPDTFPKDVYVPEGATVMAAVTVPQGCTLSLTSKTAQEQVIADYKSKMSASSWKEVMSMNQGEQSMLTYQKKERTAHIILSRADGQTQISLTVASEKSDDNAKSNE